MHPLPASLSWCSGGTETRCLECLTNSLSCTDVGWYIGNVLPWKNLPLIHLIDTNIRFIIVLLPVPLNNQSMISPGCTSGLPVSCHNTAKALQDPFNLNIASPILSPPLISYDFSLFFLLMVFRKSETAPPIPWAWKSHYNYCDTVYEHQILIKPLRTSVKSNNQCLTKCPGVLLILPALTWWQ